MSCYTGGWKILLGRRRSHGPLDGLADSEGTVSVLMTNRESETDAAESSGSQVGGLMSNAQLDTIGMRALWVVKQ